MKYLKLLLILSIGIFQCGESQTLSFAQLVKAFIGKFDSVVGTGTNMRTIFNLIVGGSSEESKAIIKDLGTIKNKLQSMDEHISSKLQNMEDILRQLQKGPEIQEMRRELSVGIQMINDAWHVFSIYFSSPNSTSNVLVEDYVTTYYDKITHFVDIQKTIAPGVDVAGIGSQSLPILLARDMLNNREHICGTGAGSHQYLMNLFLIILNAEVRATVLLTFIGKLKYRDARNWEAYSSALEWQFEQRHDAYVHEFARGLSIALREYRSCDPPEGWVKDISYFELDKFNQATMFRAPRDWIYPNRIDCDRRAEDMTRRKAKNICENYLVDCYDKQEEVCDGSLTECLVTSNVEKCVLKNQSRRYQWVNARGGNEIWGRIQDGCESGEVVPPNNAWYCLCHCIDKRNKVSLEMATSNLHQKRVVTAMRFAKKNNIIFIQIKEGKLGAKGTISQQINEWIPSSPPTDPEKLVVFDSIDNAFNVGAVIGYHNEVVAGVGFTRSSEKSGKRLKLQILVIKFQYSTGLILGRRRNITSHAIANDVHNIGDLNSIDAVTKVENVEDSLPGHYERFYRSPLTADAGQATVPLFDATPVEGDPVRPLSGVGLLHKSVHNYAGFLSLKAIGVDDGYFFKKFYFDKVQGENEFY